jgi:hypothetical protein
VWSDRISKIGSLTFFQIDSNPVSVLRSTGAILASAIIRRFSGVRFKSTSIATEGVDIIAPMIARQAIL